MLVLSLFCCVPVSDEILELSRSEVLDLLSVYLSVLFFCWSVRAVLPHDGSSRQRFGREQTMEILGDEAQLDPTLDVVE